MDPNDLKRLSSLNFSFYLEIDNSSIKDFQDQELEHTRSSETARQPLQTQQ